MFHNILTLNNGIKIPQLGLGTWFIHDDIVVDAIKEAVNVGYRHFDTAQAYGNEIAVGNAIVKSGIDRKELFLVTKVNYKSYENVRETVEQSLKNLQTDYIDLLILHWPLQIITMHGVNWKNFMKRVNYGLLVCQILNRDSLLT